MTTAAEAVRRLDDAAAEGRLAELCQRHGIDLLVLFGSAVEDPESARDVDLALRCGRAASPDLLQLLDELYALTAYEDFDLLDLARADPVAREHATLPGRALHEGQRGRLAEEQIAAMLLRMDTAPLRRRQLEHLASRSRGRAEQP